MAVKKDEKTGTWYFYGSYKMKNGKYRQYKKRGFPKKKDAVKAEILFKENIKDPYKNITLEELFNIYAAYTEKRIKESTYKVQNRLLERWIDILGDVNIKSITTHDIECAMELMINNVGYETAKNYLSRINKMLRFAVRKGYLETNPCSPIELAKNPNEKKTEMKYWTLEQFNLFIPYVENPLYHLLFDNQYSYRTITMPQFLSDEYREFKEMLDVPEKSFVFGIDIPVCNTTVRTRMREAIKLANENNEEQIPIIRIHDLRHSCASYMIGNMVRDGSSHFSLYDVAKRLGDNLSTVLSVYAHWLPQADKGIAKLMDKDNALD